MAESVDRIVDVLVVGAGPVGLSLACELRRQGVECVLVDDDDGPTPIRESRALGIHARTLEAFQRLGVADAMVAEGRRLNGLSVYNGLTRITGMRLAFDLDDTRYPFVLCLPQSRTERILVDRLSELGGGVTWGTRLASFTADDDGATAELKNASGQTSRIRARWLVGCDGSRSAVRHGLGLAFKGGDYEQRFLLADVRLDWSKPADEISVVLTPGGPLASFPLPEAGRWRLVDTTGLVEADSPDAIVARFRELVNRHAAPEATVDQPSWTSSFGIRRRVVNRFRLGRCFVAGDAAHLHSPAGGQGMNTGVQDAVNLAWKLALAVRGEASAGLLDSYDAERRPVALAVLRGTDLMTRVVTLHNPLARGLRNGLFRMLARLGVVRRKASLELSELAVGYRDSPIVAKDAPGWFMALRQGGGTAFKAERAFRRGPRAGDRMPDPPIGTSDPATGRERRLSDVVFEGGLGGGHVLLVFQGTEPESGALEVEFLAEEFVSPRRAGRIRPILVEPKLPVEPSPAWKGQRLADPTNALHRRFGAVGACLYLIRPDGYIGYRGQPLDAFAFREYLKRIFR
ncbi:MAG: FAD-dependent monooxygenase [Paludisphaera borealis]|uniref:FAD-dependent monooxygenase n=1 Tax=Paludisphaera borealis TaxID=1387353 RepID=UPI002849757F|nr:FAD-dependent monooxygenase [Paludisphaera borealis]MDR3618288.1 FAD-dependent monooxygenase [Paludisphaera borealis]